MIGKFLYLCSKTDINNSTLRECLLELSYYAEQSENKRSQQEDKIINNWTTNFRKRNFSGCPAEFHLYQDNKKDILSWLREFLTDNNNILKLIQFIRFLKSIQFISLLKHENETSVFTLINRMNFNEEFFRDTFDNKGKLLYQKIKECANNCINKITIKEISLPNNYSGQQVSIDDIRLFNQQMFVYVCYQVNMAFVPRLFQSACSAENGHLFNKFSLPTVFFKPKMDSEWSKCVKEIKDLCYKARYEELANPKDMRSAHGYDERGDSFASITQYKRSKLHDLRPKSITHTERNIRKDYRAKPRNLYEVSNIPEAYHSSTENQEPAFEL